MEKTNVEQQKSKKKQSSHTSVDRIITPGQLVLRRFLRNRLAILGVIILLTMTIFSFIGPFFSPYGEYEMFYKEKITSAIYVIAGNNDIYSFNDGDGALRWHITTEEKIVGQPIIAEDGNIYLSVEGSKVLQISPEEGTIMETHNVGDPSEAVENIYEPTPVAPDNLDIAVEDGVIVATSQDTKVKKWDFIGYSDIIGDPISDRSGYLYAVSDEGELYSIRADRGILRWSYKVDAEGPYSVMEGPIIMKTIDSKAQPSKEHWLGTDAMGLDVLTRLMYGGRISLMVGFIVIFMELILGVLLGGISGYYGGWVDNLIMRIVDVFNCIPSIPVMLILGSVMISLKVPPQDKIYVLMLVLGLLGWPGVARIVRGQILSLREQEFMVAAEATGLRPMRKIFKHLVPNVMPQLIVIATLGIGSVILTESAMSFLGIGLSFPYASWGNMVDAVNDPEIMRNCLNIWVPPGICILLTVMSFNLVGDGLRDAFDPKMKR